MLAIALLLGGSFAYAYKIEPNWIAISYVPVEMRRLAPAFQGYQIAQISDVHADQWMTQDRLLQIVKLVNYLQPDTIAITGDFVTRDAEAYEPSLVEAFKAFAPKDLTVAVLGNHDHWSSPEVIRRMLKSSNIVDVSNAVASIQRQEDVLYLAGVDDVMTQNDRLDQVLEQLPATGAAILLAHEPDFADTSAATGRFDLQISGHSHGGQVMFPFLGPPVLPPYGKKYPSGRYQVGDMVQYTNRGVGMVRPQLRFNCRPEITVFVLQTAPNSL
ncbi:MAG: metallophosphoesterase [Oscillatoriophycideae cyanobacterium NC_groundwater_1537_Pr4_S-0.65um_50_18]|nr:metallophosphoesterase [Oscillatoriophycideae cyanobacterium NC_groundwater_1537_Pr4_S-0.65um_50_18]